MSSRVMKKKDSMLKRTRKVDKDKFNKYILRKGLTFGNSRPYYYKQTVQGYTASSASSALTTTLTQTNAIQNIFFAFRLDQLPQASTFASLYDQYCISKVVVKLMPINQPAHYVSGVVTPTGGVIATVIDQDGGAALTQLSEYLQYQSFRVQPTTSNRMITRVIVPQVRMNVTTVNLGTTDGVTKRKQWIDITDLTVNHYGMWLYLDPWNSAANNQTYQIFVTYYVKFKNVR